MRGSGVLSTWATCIAYATVSDRNNNRWEHPPLAAVILKDSNKLFVNFKNANMFVPYLGS
jgi:hypothetical protein